MTDEFKARHGIKVKIVATVNDDRHHRIKKSCSLTDRKVDFDPNSHNLPIFGPRKGVFSDGEKLKKMKKSP